MTEQLSNCCNAPVRVRGSHETTRWFECTKCGFSCNATTYTAKLAKCMCGNEPQWGNADGKHWVKCPNYDCHALTPRFSAQFLADAAWNRMMGEPWKGISTPKGSEDCFKAILPNIDDRLEQLANDAETMLKEAQKQFAISKNDSARNLLSAVADELQDIVSYGSSPKGSAWILICAVRDAIRAVLDKP